MCYEKRRKGNTHHNSVVYVYRNCNCYCYVGYDSITNNGQGNKNPCLFSFTHYVMNALRHHVKHVRHAPKLYNHLTL